jgi:hypothetical protein
VWRQVIWKVERTTSRAAQKLMWQAPAATSGESGLNATMMHVRRRGVRSSNAGQAKHASPSRKARVILAPRCRHDIRRHVAGDVSGCITTQPLPEKGIASKARDLLGERSGIANLRE